MLKSIRTLIVCSLLFCSSLSANDVADEFFEGIWCGAWDERYPVCFHIPNITKSDLVIYRWKEFSDGDFSSKEIKLKRVNKNTLSLDNIYFFLDDQQPNLEAVAVGIFKAQSRLAILSKQPDSMTIKANK